MPSIITTQLERRAEEEKSGLSGIYIAGIVVAAILFLCVAAWLAIRWNRKRNTKQREAKMDSAFLSVRGVVKEGAEMEQGKVNLPSLRIETSSSGNGFSRNQMGPGIVLPDRVITPRVGAGSRDEIVNFHRQSGTYPKPFSFALGRGGTSPIDPPSSPSSNDRSSWIRHSFLSARSSNTGGHRFSVMSSTSSSFGSEPTTGTTRKVRQLFSPVLPDELLLTKVGEQLTVLQSFDDGWCVVGRENTSGFQQKKSLFKNTTESDNNVELGVVPAWCFLKPVQGLRAERPMRSSSLGITVQVQGPGFSSRNDLVSWSNF